jgi:hypothetical protein
MQPAQVFISYRRDDAAGYARAIGDELARQFGAERVFIDVDDIHAGQPFSEVIERQIGASQVLLVLIGRRWLGEQAGGSPRIGEAGDFVRREVAAGLAQGARVIPVLLDGAPMPSESQLPAELRALAGRNALEIDNSRYPADMSRLVSALRDALEGSGPTALPLTKRTGRAPGLAVALVGAVFVVGVIAALWPRHQALNPFVDERPLRPESGVSDRTASRPDVNGLWQRSPTTGRMPATPSASTSAVMRPNCTVPPASWACRAVCSKGASNRAS